MNSLGSGVWDMEFSGWDFGFRVKGLDLRVRVYGSGSKILGLRFKGCRVVGF